MIKKLLYLFCLSCLFSFSTVPLIAQCQGGMVSTTDGETLTYACVDDDDSDYVGFTNNSTERAEYLYIITNDQNEVLALPDDNFLDFNNAGAGTCRVWGLSYTGDLTVMVGDLIAADGIFSTDCYSLSSNYITIIRVVKEESNVMTTDGANTVAINDNAAATVEYMSTPIVNANYQFVITRADNKIIGIDATGSFDFATFDEGKYFIWGYAYYGDFLLEVGDYLTGNIATACFVKSDDLILVQKTVASSIVGCNADGASVKTTSGQTMEYACVDDGESDYIGFLNTSIVNSSYRFLVTDEDNIILALPTDNFINFENVAPGTCRVWGLSYHGDFSGMLGDNAATSVLATECFDLSDNFIVVIRTSTEETEVSTIDGENFVEIVDNAEASIGFTNTGTGLANYIYFITDQNDQIFGISNDGAFDFSILEEGKYFVWGYSYVGNILVEVGDEMMGAISDGCFMKSDDFVLVKKRVDAIVPEPCTADAGTLTIDASPVALSGGLATVSATPNGDLNLPMDLELIYILTSGNDVVIQMFASLPTFTVTSPGLYTLHTLVAELNDISAVQYFDASGIIIGQTTGSQVLDMIEEQGVCADLDIVGAPVEVFEEQGCMADAGFLFATNSQVPAQFFTIIMASHVIEPTLPLDYELIYLLATADGIIRGSGDNPVFLVEGLGTYTILTLVAETSDPASSNYFDFSTIDIGVTSVDDLIAALEQLEICISFDAVGAQITVIEATDSIETRSEESEEAQAMIISKEQLRLFPNPTHDYLQVQLTTIEENNSPLRVRISDLSGRQLYDQTIEWIGQEHQLQINVNDFAPGLYQLVLFNKEGQWTQQFYKQ